MDDPITTPPAFTTSGVGPTSDDLDTKHYLARNVVTGAYVFGVPSEDCVTAWREYVDSGSEELFYVEVDAPPAKRGQKVVTTLNVVEDIKPWEPVPGDFIPVRLVEVNR